MKTMMLAAVATLALTGAALADGEQGPGWQQQQRRQAMLAQRAPSAVAQNGTQYHVFVAGQAGAAAAFHDPNQGSNS